MLSIHDIHPQRFYLLSARNRRLFEFSSSGHILEKAVEDAFNRIKCVEGGNIHAVYVYEESMLTVMNELADKYKSQYPQVQQLPAYLKQCKVGEYIIRQNTSVPLFSLKSSIVKVLARAHGLDTHKAHQAFAVNWARLSLSFDAYFFLFWIVYGIVIKFSNTEDVSIPKEISTSTIYKIQSDSTTFYNTFIENM